MKLIILQVPDAAFNDAMKEAHYKLATAPASHCTNDMLYLQLSRIFGSEVAIHGIYEGGKCACPDVREFINK